MNVTVEVQGSTLDECLELANVKAKAFFGDTPYVLEDLDAQESGRGVFVAEVIYAAVRTTTFGGLE